MDSAWQSSCLTLCSRVSQSLLFDHFLGCSHIPAQLICKTPGRSFALALSRTLCLEDIHLDEHGVNDEHDHEDEKNL